MEVEPKMMPKGMILAHRGEWRSIEERNQISALARAANKGFGIETDLRDLLGAVVISHDPPERAATELGELLAVLESRAFRGVLALNIKADGLVSLLHDHFSFLRKLDYFFFDMSYPETLKFTEARLETATRQSEFERYDLDQVRQRHRTKNIWIDCFDSDWWVDMKLIDIAPKGERAFFVSPEIHGRSPDLVWKKLNEFAQGGQTFGICTDFPEDFWSFIGGKDG
jgi:hypothetical protein